MSATSKTVFWLAQLNILLWMVLGLVLINARPGRTELVLLAVGFVIAAFLQRRAYLDTFRQPRATILSEPGPKKEL